MATRLSNPAPQFFYNGTPAAPLSGGLMYFYVPGSTLVAKDTYSDNSLSVPNSNPVVLSASGVLPNVFLDGAYRVVLKDKDGVQQWDRDSVNSINDIIGNDWDSTITYGMGGTNIVYASDGYYYVSLQANNLGHDPANNANPTWWQNQWDYEAKNQQIVAAKSIAVGNATTGLAGVAIAVGAVVAGNATNGIQATTLTAGYVAIGNATNGLAGVNINTKGSIIAGNGTVPAALAAGTNGYVLSADSGQTTGLNWIPVAAVNGWQLLSTVTTAGAATVDIETGFSSTYDNYVILACNLTTAGTESILARWKLGGSYITTSTYIDASGSSTATSLVAVGNAGGGATVTGSMEYQVFGVNSGLPKTGRTSSQSAVATPALIGTNAAHYNSNTGVLSGVRFYGSSGGNVGGTFALYGVTKT